MKNSLLKVYTLVVGIIFAGTLIYFGGGLTYEHFQNNLNSATINFYAKISFCIILFFTALTLVMICLVAKNGIVDDTQDIPEPEDQVTDDEIHLNDIVEENEPDISEENSLETDDISKEDQLVSENVEPEDEELLEDIMDDIMDVCDSDEMEMPELLTPSIPKPVSDETTNFDGTQPKGLYDEKTGICWESYLNSRLENELIRASASEYDLVCFVFRLENVERSSEKGKEICTFLADEFQFKDLVFEYKNDCIVCVKTNYSIDDAINYSEKLYNHIEGMLDEGENIFIGISSRTIRMVSAERLLKEAEQAMLHAVEDEDSNIIAFRANAEKYMEMMNK